MQGHRYNNKRWEPPDIAQQDRKAQKSAPENNNNKNVKKAAKLKSN